MPGRRLEDLLPAWPGAACLAGSPLGRPPARLAWSRLSCQEISRLPGLEPPEATSAALRYRVCRSELTAADSKNKELILSPFTLPSLSSY